MSARTPTLPRTISELEHWGLDSSVADRLRQRVSAGLGEPEVVAAFIHALTESAIGDSLDRALKRAILKGWKDVAPGQQLDQEMKAALKDITAERWNWLQINHDIPVLP